MRAHYIVHIRLKGEQFPSSVLVPSASSAADAELEAADLYNIDHIYGAELMSNLQAIFYYGDNAVDKSKVMPTYSYAEKMVRAFNRRTFGTETPFSNA